MKLYDKVAPYYDELLKQDYKSDARIYDKIIRRFTKGKKLLEAGCSTGGHLLAFKELGYEVTGIDESREMIKTAKKLHPSLNVFKMKMEKLDIDDKFDAIVLLNRAVLFIEKEKEFIKLLKRFHKHLATGGVLVFDLPLHKDYFDPDKSDAHYFNNGRAEGSLIEEYDKRDDKILWSINLSIKDKGKIMRLVDNKEFLLISVAKTISLLKSAGFKPTVFSMKGRVTRNYEQPLIIAGKIS